MIALAVRSASINRHVRNRAAASAVCFGAYALISLVVARVPLDPDLTAPLHVLHTLLLIFGVVNLTVTLAVNPWRADRVPDRFPNIVQDSIIIALFALVAMLFVRREFLATTAAGALIVGLALQDTLGNLFAGLAIQIEKPFQIGHWVHIGGRDGQVSEITWRATKIRTKAGNLVVVPNNVLAKDTIVNYSVPTPQFRVEVEIGASYDAAPNHVKATIRGALADEPRIDHSHEIEVLLHAFADSAVTYRVWFWTTDFAADEQISDLVRTRIYYAFRRRGIDIPYPVQVQLNGSTGGGSGMGEAQVADALKATALFAALGDEQLARLGGASQPVVYAANETVVREGDPGSSMFVVCGGEVAVRAAGSRAELARLKAGDFFGEMSLLTGQARTATVAAAIDSRLLEIAADDFRQVVMEDPAILERMTDVMTRRRAELDQHRAANAPMSEAPEAPHRFLERVRKFLSLGFRP